MKKRILFIVILTAIVGLVFYGNRNAFRNISTAYAVGDLTVDWGIGIGDVGPIFNVLNMAPGDMEERDVDVSNGALSPRSVGVRGIKTSEIGSVSAVLDIEIKEGTTVLYGPKTLDQFFTESGGPDGIPLSEIAAGNATTYTFEVTFQQSAGNEFQETNVVFDLKIGLSIALPDACDQIDLLPNPIIGTSKAETLTGTPGNDLIIGLEGADKINGNSGDDCILGGSGADSINGNNGNDAIFGEDDADTINGNNGKDLLDGGKGADSIKGQNDEDHLIGGQDADTLDGGNSDDLLEGGDAADTLKGGNGKDILIGDAGIDFANGGPNIDTCDAETEVSCEI